MCGYCERGWWNMMTGICGERGFLAHLRRADVFVGAGPVVPLVPRSTTGYPLSALPGLTECHYTLPPFPRSIGYDAA